MESLLRRRTSVALLLFGAVGLLGVVELVFGERSPADVAVVGLLAVVVAVSVAFLRGVTGALNASVVSREELRIRLEQQQAVAQFGQLALTEVPRQELLDEACRIVAAELHADVAGILELLPDRGAFVLRAGVGWPPEQIGVQHVPAGPRSHGGYTLASSGPVIMRDAARESRFELSPHMAAEGITSGVTACIADGVTYGVLGAHTHARRDFSEHDVTFLEAVANVLASALGRRAAEEEAEKTHRVLEAVIESTTDDVFVKDVEGRLIVVNARAAETLGLPREQLIGRTLHEVLPRRQADAMAETDRIVLERGTVETFEEAVPLGGGPRVLLTTKGPYRSSDGTLLGTFGIARDISARKAQEQELAGNEERFRLAQEGARMGTWDRDLDTGETTWSAGLRELYGVGPDYPAGVEHFSELLDADDRESVTRDLLRAYADGSDLEFECRIVRPDGGLRWLLCRSSTLKNEQGRPVRFLGVAVDITERKLAEEELARSEETLRLAQAVTGLGAWSWNIDTNELTWTPGLYEIAGLDPAAYKPSYETLPAYVDPNDWVRLDAEVRRALASGESYYECSCRVLRPSGETRWVINRGTIVRDADGSPKRMFGVALDETERRRADDERALLETRLRQAEKLEAVGRLAGGVAHDFNNLLVAIRGYGEVALGGLRSGDRDVSADIEALIATADRAAGVTRQLLAFGRRQVLNPEVLDLNEVVLKTVALLERMIGDNVDMVTVLAERPVVVEADRGQLEQVLMNLAVNGRDAMPGGGVLTIGVAAANLEPVGADVAPRYALLSVADEGSGIDAVVAAHVFEPFFTTKGDEGTGLGLATVHGIVAQSGGQVMLETAEGRGSTFKVYLPLSAVDISQADVAPAVASGEGTETILLVEDDPVVRSVVSTMLAARGYEIVVAAGGEEAIARFATHERPIKLVVSDLMMHGLDGQQTIDRIREIEPTTRALYMSGYTDDAVIRTGGLGPGTSFIQKPFSGEELSTCVREMLDGPGAA